MLQNRTFLFAAKRVLFDNQKIFDIVNKCEYWEKTGRPVDIYTGRPVEVHTGQLSSAWLLQKILHQPKGFYINND